MLTADLALSWQRGDHTGPRYIDPVDADYLSDAVQLIQLIQNFEGRTRAELDEALAEYVGTGTDYRIQRGLIKLLLDRCVQMQLWIEPQPTDSYRELFGAIKAYRLLRTIKGSAAQGYEVRLDGPVSLFQRSQKYGVQMAVFLPALLLCAGWRMRAEIALKPPAAGRAFFELDSKQRRLRSHYLRASLSIEPDRDELV